MSGDKKRPASSDMEYQYADEDVGKESFMEPAKKPTPSLGMLRDKLMERLPKKKKYRVLLIIAVAIYIVYKFLSGTPAPVPATSTPEKTAAQPLSKPAVNIAPVKSVEVAKPEVKSAITSLTTPSTKDLDHVGGTTSPEQNAQMRELQTSLGQMNQAVMTLESSLVSLTSSVRNLSNKVGVLEKFRQEEKRTVQENPASTYYLQSLVPERAWVQSSAGNLTSVKVGDFLPAYGQVQKIDVQAGIVLTTSGRVIHYGPNDS